ncbi:GNAT family N-acetyltransferase [Corynebacterium sp.]|mgnify:CR=1 FL=1|uniref:GNAT family N-acetyltransferase n=1 Tax=Corynebacterium sp. TaxID=1720 RepID=UPI0025BE00AA|nr:GNAT family N-acetyltransferase [Corynebacterium sp.]
MTDIHDRTGAAVSVRPTAQDAAYAAYAVYLDDSGERAGATYYLDDGDDRIFFHTTVGEEYAGRGLAGILVDHALADTARQGRTVVPVCPYVRGRIGRTGWDGPVRTPTDTDLAAVREHTSGGQE